MPRSPVLKYNNSILQTFKKEKKEINRDDCCCEHLKQVEDVASGTIVCTGCGLVLDDHGLSTAVLRDSSRGKPTKKIYHFNERISQWLMRETWIDEDKNDCDELDFPKIVDALRIQLDTTGKKDKDITKQDVRAALRKIRLNKYLEKWIQIKYRYITYTRGRVKKMVKPRLPTPTQIERLKVRFQQLEEPFHRYKHLIHPKRHNMMNYNFVFRKLLRLEQLDEFVDFFPKISTCKILERLDLCWKYICADLNWVYLSKDLSFMDEYKT